MKSVKFVVKTLIFFCICITAYAQQPNTKMDSLEKWLTKYPKKDTIWVKNALSVEKMYSQMSPDKQGKYTIEIIEASQKLNFVRGLAMAQTYVARKLIQQGKYAEAMQAVIVKITYDKKLNDNFELGSSYSLLGYINALTTNYPKSLEYYLLSKTTAEKLPNNYPNKTLTLVGLNVNLASTYSVSGDPKKALGYSLEGLKLLRSKIKEKNSNTLFTEVAILLSIGVDYSRLMKYQKSNTYLLEGLELVQKNNIQSAYARYYGAISDNYIKLNELSKAEIHLGYLKEMFDKKQLDSDEIAIYLAHSEELSLKKNDFKSAYNWTKQFTAHTDSVKGTEQQNKIKELSVQYETKEKEAKIKQLEQDEELAKTRNNLYLGGIGMMLLLLIGAFIAIMQVQKAKKKTDVANDLRDKLFSIIAHDLRTPTANLQKVTSTIKYVFSKKDDAMIADLSTTIQDSATSLSGLVDNLLHWSLLQQGKVAIHPEKFVLLYEVKELMDTLRSRAATKNIQLVFDETSLVEVFADRMMVQIIVRNLLDNAIKFTREGKKISAEIVSDNQKAELRIIDEGIGISDSIRAVLFENNASQKGRKGTHGEKGTGMGLYLCHELAVMNKGDVYLAETHENVGSIFVLKLPMQ